MLGDGGEAGSGLVEPRLAAGGKSLAALPKFQGVFEGYLAGLKALDHADKLLARLLVGELGDVGAQLMGPRGGGVGGQAHVGIMSRADAGACAHERRDPDKKNVCQNVLTDT